MPERAAARHAVNDNAADPLEALNLTPAMLSLARRGDLRRYRKGVLLIEEGAAGDTLYLVLTGRVRAYSLGSNDRELTFGVYGPGEYVGEMSLDGGPRSASVITLEPTTCSVVTRQTLREHIGAHPDFAFELLARVIRRARLATSNARSMALIDVYGRVVRLLEELAVPQGDGTRVIEERLTHAEIASRVGCSREMVSRLMKDLRAGKQVCLKSGRLVLAARLPARW
jgi:CRP/FNR family transcriptional regulator, cyclic AMP receptor protein